MTEQIRATNLTVAGSLADIIGLEDVSGIKRVRRYPAASLSAQIQQDVASQIAAAITAQQAQNYKASCVVATTGNVNLAGGGLASGTVINGVTLSTGQRVLVLNQNAPAENGIYVVPASGAASRATDADTAAELLGAKVYVEGGTNANFPAFTTWVCLTNPITTLGTTPISFGKFGTSETNVRADVGPNPNGIGGAPTVFTRLVGLEPNFAPVPTSRNLYNSAQALPLQGLYYNPSGNLSAGSNFCTTGKMAISPSSDYTFSIVDAPPRFYVTLEANFWNAAGAWLSYTTTFISNDGRTVKFTSPGGAFFVSFNIAMIGVDPDIYDFKGLVNRMQLTAGRDTIRFEPYVPANSVAPLKKRGGLTIAIDGGYNIYVRDQWSDTQDKLDVWKATETKYGDYSFTFAMGGPVTSGLIPRGTAKTVFDTVQANAYSENLAGELDDNPPVWPNSYALGGNHAPGCWVVSTSVTHDKTNADIGSKWTDTNGAVWVIARVPNNSQVVLVGMYGGTPTAWTLPLPALGATLTHTSGATHTASMGVSGYVFDQLYPFAQNQTVRMYLDENEIRGDGIYEGDVFKIAQSYGIPNPRSMIDSLIARAGSTAEPSYNAPTIQTQLLVTITWTFRPGELATVDYDLVAVQATTLDHAVGSQFGGLWVDPAAPGGAEKRFLFIPNSLTESYTGLNFSTPQDITAGWALAWQLETSEWADPTDPPATIVQISKSAANVPLKGAMIGYSHLVGDGVPAARVTALSGGGKALEIGTGGKMYPWMFSNIAAAAGEYHSVLVFRGFFDPSIDANIIAQGVYSWGGKQYWICYLVGGLTNVWIKPREGALNRMIGKKISVTGNGKKSSTLTLKSSFVSGKGVLVSTSGLASMTAEIG